MKTLYLLRGLPGSGKTTLADALGGIHYEADQWFYEDGEYKFDASKLGLAHKWCQDMVKQWLLNSSLGKTHYETIVVSNTFTTEKEMKPYLEMAEYYGWRVTSIVVENRHGGKSIHGVPEATMEKMEKRFSIKLR